jgi:hypothetical protein
MGIAKGIRITGFTLIGAGAISCFLFIVEAVRSGELSIDALWCALVASLLLCVGAYLVLTFPRNAQLAEGPAGADPIDPHAQEFGCDQLAGASLRVGLLILGLFLVIFVLAPLLIMLLLVTGRIRMGP